MVVADDELSPAESPLDQALEKGAPMHFCLAEGDADAEQKALTSGSDAERNENGAIPALAVVADFFMASIKHQIGIGAERPFAVEKFDTVANLGRTDALVP